MSNFLQCISAYKPLVDFFQALLAPAIAIVVAWIAWRQHKNDTLRLLTDRQRLRAELYDRRLKVFDTVRRFLSDMSGGAKITMGLTSTLQTVYGESHFLFDSEIPEYLKKLHGKAVRNFEIVVLLEKQYLDQTARGKLADEASELFNFFDSELKTLKDHFEPYLKLDLKE